MFAALKQFPIKHPFIFGVGITVCYYGRRFDDVLYVLPSLNHLTQGLKTGGMDFIVQKYVEKAETINMRR